MEIEVVDQMPSEQLPQRLAMPPHPGGIAKEENNIKMLFNYKEQIYLIIFTSAYKG